MCIRILVLGPSNSGKSDLVNTLLYNMTIPPQAKPPGPRTYRYSLTFPPPAIYLEIVKSDRLLPLQGVSAVIVMNPNDLDYVENTVKSVQQSAVDALLILSKRDLLQAERGGNVPSKFQAQTQLKELCAEIKEKESQLTALKAEIKSHQRLLNQLAESDKTDMTAKLQHEVFIRDKQITILHDRLIVLDAEIRSCKVDFAPLKNRQEETQAAELLRKVRLELEANIAAMKEEAEIERKRWIDERKAFVDMQELLNREIDTCKGVIAEKDTALYANSRENADLAESVRQKEWEIRDLQQKLATLGGTIEQLNLRLTDERQKSAEVAELEKQLAESNARNDLLETRIAKLTEEVSKLQSENQVLEQVNRQERRNVAEVKGSLSEQIQKVTELQERLKSTESEFAKQLADVKSSLEASVTSLQQVYENLHNRELEEQEVRIRRAEDALHALKATLHSKEEERVKQDRLLSVAEAQSVALKKRISELEDAAEMQKQRVLEQTKREEMRGKTANDELENSRKRASQLMVELSDKESALAKSQNQFVTLLGKLEEARKTIDDQGQKLLKSESLMKENQSHLALLQSEHSDLEKQSVLKDVKLKQLLSRVKSLEDELWNKDSDNLKRESATLKYLTQIEDLKKSLQQAHAKLRTAAADQLAEMNAALERKDAEIALLKEMVRSAKIQVKGEIARSKKKSISAETAKPMTAAPLERISEEMKET